MRGSTAWTAALAFEPSLRLIRVAPLAYAGAGAAAVGAGLYFRGALLAFVLLLVVGVCAVLVGRINLAHAGLLAACGAAFAAPWNAVIIWLVRPGDLLLLIALVCFVAASGLRDLPRLPWWVLQLAITIVVLAGIHEVAPAGAEFIRQHTFYTATGQAVVATPSNLGIGARWLVSLVGVSMVVAYAVRYRREAAGWIAGWFAAGASVSGGIAVTDRLGLTGISRVFIYPDPTGRQAGLTVHPNHLAAGCVIAIPIALWLISRTSRRDRALGWFCLLFALLGIYVSGSRGGAVTAVLAVGLSLLVLRSLRPALPAITLTVVVGTVAAVTLNPSLIDRVLAATRLGGDSKFTAASDDARDLLAEQGLADFLHSSVIGVGLQVALDAHSILLQTLAAGGIVLLVSFGIFAVCLLRAAALLSRPEQLARALFTCVACWLVLGIVENLLIDRYLYVPVGLIIALVIAERAVVRPTRTDRQEPTDRRPAEGAR